MRPSPLRSILGTLRQPVVVLDADDRVAYANAAFLQAFRLTAEETTGTLFAALGDGQWDIPDLASQLAALVPDGAAIENFTVERDLPRVGMRSLRINARKFFEAGDPAVRCLLSIEDATDDDSKAAHTRLARHLDEVNHRVKNNIATMSAMVGLEGLALKGREASAALARIARRMQAFSSLYAILALSADRNQVIVADYLEELAEALQELIDPRQTTVRIGIEAASLAVRVDKAAQIGSIVNELIGNAAVRLARARTKGRIGVRFAADGDGYMLTVSDDGEPLETGAEATTPILGQQIVTMYVDSLGGKVTREADSDGHRVAIWLPAGIAAGSPPV